MRTRNILCIFLVVVLVIFLHFSCSPVKVSSKVPADENIVNYFSSVLDTANLVNPDKAYYKEIISVEDIGVRRLSLWNEWKKANMKRLATWPSIKENTLQDSLLWYLPTDKKALFTIMKKGNRPKDGYPMFINLHGGGTFPDAATPWGPDENDREWLAAKYLSQKYADSPSLYFIPRMADDRRGRWYHSGEQAEFIRAWQLAVLSGDADPNKIYIEGISEGGYGSFRMGPFFADYFAAAGPMAGASNINEAPIENMRNTPFIISVGEYDFAYGRVDGAREWKKYLDSAAKSNSGQFIHEVDIQSGRGHGIDYYKTAPWLKQFTRNPYPDTVSFQYYAVHDTVFDKKDDTSFTYRKGFGYIRLDGLSHSVEKDQDGLLKTGIRDFYIEKKGNVYHIRSFNRIGSVSGFINIYLDKVDFLLPVTVYFNGEKVYNDKVKPNIGTMMESLALFGDPDRIFAAKIRVKISS